MTILVTLNHHKSLDEINVVDGSTCPCGTHPIFNGSGAVTACQPLECSLDCGSSCTNSFALDGHTSSDTDDVHHLGRHNKVCRFNNDASCHSCPTSSCQYPVGNFYGSGFPCKHIEGSQTTFAGLNFDATDSNGIGQTITLASGYNNGQSETIEFCSSDEYEIGLLNCGVDKLGLIVSPKTCTHCQIARCVNIADAWRYLDWNAADIKALFNSAGEYIGTAGKHQVAESTHHPKLSSSVTIPADGFCATGGLLGDNNNCAGCGNACTNGEVCFHNLFCMCPYGSLDDDNNCGTCGTKCGNSNTVCVMFNGSPSCNCPSGELGDRK